MGILVIWIKVRLNETTINAIEPITHLTQIFSSLGMQTKYFDQNDPIDQDNDRIDHLNIYLFNWYLYLNKLIIVNDSTKSITTKDKEYNMNTFYSGLFVVPNNDMGH